MRMSGMKKRSAVSGGCSSSGGSSDSNQDWSNVNIEQTELVHILGKRVIHVEKWWCPVENAGWALSLVGVGHQGVVVTLEDHVTRYLVHKLPSNDVTGDG